MFVNDLYIEDKVRITTKNGELQEGVVSCILYDDDTDYKENEVMISSKKHKGVCCFLESEIENIELID